MEKTCSLMIVALMFVCMNAGVALADGQLIYEPLPQVESVSGAIAASDNATGETNITDTQAIVVPQETRVPQAQIDLRDKRYLARERRDMMLQVRAETIEKLDREESENDGQVKE